MQLQGRRRALGRFTKQLAQHLEGIISSPRYRLNTSVQESMNDRIKVVRRMAYRYRNTTYFSLKIRATLPGTVR